MPNISIFITILIKFPLPSTQKWDIMLFVTFSKFYYDSYGGAPMALLQSFEYDSSDLRMYYYVSDHNMHFHLHTNSMIELRCFFGGKGTHYVEGLEHTEQPGDILVIRPGEAHYPMVDLSVPYERASIIISPELLRTLVGNDTLLRPIYEREPGIKNLYHAEALDRDPRYYFRKMTANAPDQRANILAYTILLLQQISTAYEKERFAATPSESIAHRLLQYIDMNLEQELSIKALCEEFYISSAQLGRIIKKVSGIPVGQYITAKRLSKARLLIRQGQKPTHICFACGYPNYASFYRAYHKFFGITPKTEYLQATKTDL